MQGGCERRRWAI